MDCYTGNPCFRVLTGVNYIEDTQNTLKNCLEFCQLNNFKLAGVENGSF
jgi:hypothetical protein